MSKKRRLVGGDVVRDSFLGIGTIVQRLGPDLVYVLWDETPPEDYNCGVNPSVVFDYQLGRLETRDKQGRL